MTDFQIEVIALGLAALINLTLGLVSIHKHLVIIKTNLIKLLNLAESTK